MIYPPFYLSILLHILLSIYSATHPSIYPLYPPIHPSIYLLYPPIHPAIYLRPPIYSFTHPPIYIFCCASFYLSNLTPIYLTVSIYTNSYLSDCIYLFDHRGRPLAPYRLSSMTGRASLSLCLFLSIHLISIYMSLS